MNTRTRLPTFPSAIADSMLEWRTDPARKTAHLSGGAVNESGQSLAMCNHIYPPRTRGPTRHDRYCPLCVDVALDCGVAVPEDAACWTRRCGSLLWVAALIAVLAAVTIWAISPLF